MKARLPLVAALVAGLAVAAALTTATVVAGTEAQTPTPTAQGRVLVQRFFTLLQKQDRNGLRVLLAPSFQVVRANGAVQGRAAYLADPPKVDRFRISRLKGSKNEGVLVVSYQVTAVETVGGVEQPKDPAPRLSVFHRQDGAWRLVSHANFGAIVKPS